MRHVPHLLPRPGLPSPVTGRSLFRLGPPRLEAALQGGLEHSALHELLADAAHPASAIGFGLALAACATRKAPQEPRLSPEILWVRQRAALEETGNIYAPGLLAFGIDPARLTLVTARSALDLARIGIEAARCPAIGAVLLETVDTGAKLDLTATRRLVLATEKGRGSVLLVRIAPTSVPTAARTRWHVRAPSAPRPCEPRAGPLTSPEPSAHRHRSTPSENTWDLPRFDIRLLRHRAGLPEQRWHVEWNREQQAFQEAVSEPVVPVPVGGRLAA